MYILSFKRLISDSFKRIEIHMNNIYMLSLITEFHIQTVSNLSKVMYFITYGSIWAKTD